ncbi:MAG: hypothetical protein WBB36_17475 [Chitinophagales bacterium]
MSDYQRISELNSKISFLLEAVRKNGGHFTGIDKDLITNYMRELYELVLAVQPSVNLHAQPAIEIPSVIEKTDPITIADLPKKIEIIPEIVVEPVLSTDKMSVVANHVETEPELIPDKIAIEPTENSQPKEEKVPEREVKKNPASVSKKSISELYAEKTEATAGTLNDKYKSQGKEIADTLKLTPIKDLKSYIGLNKRVNFISSLFNGGEQQYDAAISKVNSFVNYQEALNYVQQHIANEYKWKEEEPLVSEFFTLLMRRYLN